jgi:hypothetical protein
MSYRRWGTALAVGLTWSAMPDAQDGAGRGAAQQPAQQEAQGAAPGPRDVGQAAASDTGREVDLGRQPPASEESCFNVSAARDFDGLSDRHIVLHAQGQDYLLTVDRACPGLSEAEGIAIVNPSARICSNSLAEISYRGVGGRLEQCLVTQVEAIADRATALELSRLRSAAARE